MWGRERGGKREDRRRRGGAGQRGWRQGLKGKGRGRGKGRRKGPGADPFNVVDVRAGMDMRRREWRSQRESVIADILEVSEDEGEGAGRMAVEGGPGQPSAPNVLAAAIWSIPPEVRRQEEGKGGRGQLEAGAAGSGDSSVSTGGRGRTGKGGKGQAGTSGAVHAKGHLAGKGGKGSGRGRQWPQPQRSFRQPPPRLPLRVSAAVRAEEEREARRQQAARYEALAHVEHQCCRHQPPEQGPDTIYQLEREPGRTGMRGGQAEQSSAAVQSSGAGQVEAGRGKQGKGAGQKGLQGKGQGTAGPHGVGGKGRGAKGRQGKGQGKGGGLGYMGSPVFPGTGLVWWGGVVLPAVPPIIPSFPPPPYPAMGMMYPPLPAYPGMQPPAHMQQHQQAGGTAWGAQEGKGEEHRRAWERLGEAERSMREREARVKEEVGGAEEGRTEETDRPQGGEAQAVEEVQRAWADLRRRQEGVERVEREGGRQEEGSGWEDIPLVPFRQPAVPPEQEGEMQERAWRRIRGEAARLADRDREVAARERRVREEAGVARGAHRVIPDPEGDTPSTDVEGRSPSGKRAREEDEEAGQERGKRRRGEERGAGEAEGAPRPASPSPEPTPTDWDSESPPLRQYAPPPVQRGPGMVAGWTEGEVAELARYVKWAERRGEGGRIGGPAPSGTWSAGRGGPGKGGRRWMRGGGGGWWGRRTRGCACTVPGRRGRSPGFRCCESCRSERCGTVATRRAGQEQERKALGAGGQGPAEGRADGMRGGGRGASAEVEEGEEGIWQTRGEEEGSGEVQVRRGGQRHGRKWRAMWW